MEQPKYRFYATLLDSFQYYMDSDMSFQDMIDRINRVPFDSEPAKKGTAFNNLVDEIISSGCSDNFGSEIEYEGFVFKKEIALCVAEKVLGGIPQVHTSGLLSTPKGLVEVYGYMDELLPFAQIADIKTTGNYQFPKYNRGYQHIVYPFCESQKTGVGAYLFNYVITDFKEVYVESYAYDASRDVPKLTAICLQLIEFLEAHRHLITDKKVFGIVPSE